MPSRYQMQLPTSKKSGYNSPYGNIRNESWLANLGWDTGIDPSQFMPTQLSNEQLYGENFDFLQGNLKDTIGGKLDPALMQLLSAGKRNISQFGDTSRRNINQQLASSGFRGSGANLTGDIFAKQSGAMGDLTANVGQMGMQNRQNAIMQLLGLNQFQAGQNVGQQQYQTGAFQSLAQMLQSGAMQRRGLDQQNGSDPWGSILGGLASAAPYAAIALSDKKLKENIKKTGEKTKDGIPIVEFNYKGDTKRYRGVLAQDAEKKKPSAVVKAVDYSKI
jgi:hypothetical protein